MPNSLYHLRRLAISYVYEVLLNVIAWALRLKKQNNLVTFFALSCILCGIAFTLYPAAMASLFEFNSLSVVALTDIRAYYGTMLIALGIALAVLAARDATARPALLVIAAFALGSAIGRVIGFATGTPFMSVHGLLVGIEFALGIIALKDWRRRANPLPEPEVLPMLDPKTPEDFRPLTQQGFKNPYAYYKMLRDQYPVYVMPEQNFYLISRYEDICAMCLNTTTYSSKLMEILVRGKPKAKNDTSKSAVEILGEWGVVPVDVMAIQDQPMHTAERKVGHSGFNAKYVKSLEPEVTALCREMMDEFLPKGNVEFVQEFAWRLPMRLIIGLLGLPDKDFEQIKLWCMDGIRSLSGTATVADLVEIGATNGPFMRYLWKYYLEARQNLKNGTPKNNFTEMMIKMVDEPPHSINDQRAVAIILQLLIAGSDSSASTMGNAIRILAQRPDIEAKLRADSGLINEFIEEVFRSESAFQGHFRVTTQTSELHGVKIPEGSRVFLMWASGNRDERFWANPEEFEMGRANGKKHLTFGHGIHACLGRELARMEIRIVIRELLARTKRMAIVGDTPFESSIFSRTLLRLPLAFEVADDINARPAEEVETEENTNDKTEATTTTVEQKVAITEEIPAGKCPFGFG